MPILNSRLILVWVTLLGLLSLPVWGNRNSPRMPARIVYNQQEIERIPRLSEESLIQAYFGYTKTVNQHTEAELVLDDNSSGTRCVFMVSLKAYDRDLSHEVEQAIALIRQWSRTGLVPDLKKMVSVPRPELSAFRKSWPCPPGSCSDEAKDDRVLVVDLSHQRETCGNYRDPVALPLEALSLYDPRTGHREPYRRYLDHEFEKVMREEELKSGHYETLRLPIMLWDRLRNRGAADKGWGAGSEAVSEKRTKSEPSTITHTPAPVEGKDLPVQTHRGD